MGDLAASDDFMKLIALLILSAVALLPKTFAEGVSSGYSLKDLKKLDIICFVPGWLPKGYHLSRVYLDYTDTDGLDNSNAKGYVAYQVEYSDGRKERSPSNRRGKESAIATSTRIPKRRRANSRRSCSGRSSSSFGPVAKRESRNASPPIG